MTDRNMLTLEATAADYAELWAQMPVAHERLKTIILMRMLGEKDAELAQLRPEEEPHNDKYGPEQVTVPE